MLAVKLGYEKKNPVVSLPIVLWVGEKLKFSDGIALFSANMACTFWISGDVMLTYLK